ncbi:MAG: hypothetical protein ACOYVD_16205 [Bacillota bacterium]
MVRVAACRRPLPLKEGGYRTYCPVLIVSGLLLANEVGTTEVNLSSLADERFLFLQGYQGTAVS